MKCFKYLLIYNRFIQSIINHKELNMYKYIKKNDDFYKILAEDYIKYVYKTILDFLHILNQKE